MCFYRHLLSIYRIFHFPEYMRKPLASFQNRSIMDHDFGTFQGRGIMEQDLLPR